MLITEAYFVGLKAATRYFYLYGVFEEMNASSAGDVVTACDRGSPLLSSSQCTKLTSNTFGT